MPIYYIADYGYRRNPSDKAIKDRLAFLLPTVHRPEPPIRFLVSRL